MAEAVLFIETSLGLPMTCDNAVGIERGAYLTLSDPLTAATCTASAAAVAGFAAEEKIASDGKTKVPVYREGWFKVTASGSITVGDALIFDTSSTVSKAAVASEHIAGYALETATDAETFLMELKPRHTNKA